MMRKRLALNLMIEPGFCICAAIILLSLPMAWSLSWLVSVLFHEFCHIVTLLLFRKKICSIKIGLFGAQINTEILEPFVELVSASAGPLGGVLLMIFIRAYPQLSICALVQSIFNLLPIYPMDGGRIIHGLFSMFFNDEKTKKLCNRIEVITYIFLLLILLFLMVISGWYFLCGVIFLPVLRQILINLLAKKNNR